MKLLKYKNFNELLIGINNLVLSRTNEFVFKQSGPNGYIVPLVIECDSFYYSFDLGNLSYTSNKFSKLIKTYIDPSTLLNFKSKLCKSSSTTLTFYFNQEKKKQGSTTDNGPCILSIVFTRDTRRDKWSKANVMYRTTEVNRRFAADLLMLNRFFTELPDCCEIDKVRFFIPQAYVSGSIISAYLNVFNFEYEDLDEDIPLHNFIIKFYDRCLSDPNNLSTYKSVLRVQRKYFGLKKWKPMLPEQFSIVRTLSL